MDSTEAAVWRRNGRRVAYHRELAGKTQAQLAEAIGVTQAHMSLLENGKRRLDKRNMLAAIADALGVPLNVLAGDPAPARLATDLPAVLAVKTIRAALYQPTGQTEPRPVEQLAAAVDAVQRAWMYCDYRTLGELVPAVLTDARTRYDAGDRDRDRILELLVRTCVTGALATKALGHGDLGQVLADHARRAAVELGDPVCLAAGRYATAQCALAAGFGAHSYTLAADAARDLEADYADTAGNDANAWLTMLHLHAALSAAFLHRDGDVADHTAEAERRVAHVVGDPWRMEATAANVAVWKVSIAVENGHPERAPELAARVRPGDLVTPQRRGRLYLDTARGHLEVGDHDRAVQALLDADDELPVDVRRRPQVKEMVSFMAQAAAARGGSPGLLELARRVGVGPEPAGTA
jgi:transcriptional regulator with XRE-family HTH domain